MLLEVKTERLHLRPWEPRDRAPFAALNADREVMGFLPKILTRAESDDSVDRYLADGHKTGFGFLVAELKTPQLKATDRLQSLTGAPFVGMMGIRVMPDILPRVPQPAVELAFRIARPYQRQGLALEGGKALIKLALDNFQFPEVVAVVAIANTPGRRLLEKLGMTHRQDFEFHHPAFPTQHLYAKHTLYHIAKPGRTRSGIRKKAV
jgi:RimJ/RimL family protein N-acetyltransferase